jgi:hypothetical protein
MFLLLFVSWCVLSAPTTSLSKAILTHRGSIVGVLEGVYQIKNRFLLSMYPRAHVSR